MFIFRKQSNAGIAASPASPDVMKENQEYIRKRRPINFTLPDLENDEQDEEFVCQNFDPMPSTSRTLPSRICKEKILYHDKSSSDDEQNFNDGKNSIQNEDDYYEEPSERDLDPYGLSKHDTTSSDSD